MAGTKNFRELFDSIPVYGETGFARIAARHDSSNLKIKNTILRRSGHPPSFADWRKTFLAPDLSPRKAF